MLGAAFSFASESLREPFYTPSQFICDGKSTPLSCADNPEKCATAVLENKGKTENTIKIVEPPSSPSPTSTPIDTSIVEAEAIHMTPAVASQGEISNGSLHADTIFSIINQHRSQIGLPSFQRDDRLCQIAQARAPQITNEVVTGTMHSGFFALHLPYWATENIISIHSDQEAVNWWLNEPIHRHAIEGNYIYSCVACSGESCSEVFTNFQPK